MVAFCISDLHLPPGNNKLSQRFSEFCARISGAARRLLILGDLDQDGDIDGADIAEVAGGLGEGGCVEQ